MGIRPAATNCGDRNVHRACDDEGREATVPLAKDHSVLHSRGRKRLLFPLLGPTPIPRVTVPDVEPADIHRNHVSLRRLEKLVVVRAQCRFIHNGQIRAPILVLLQGNDHTPHAGRNGFAWRQECVRSGDETYAVAETGVLGGDEGVQRRRKAQRRSRIASVPSAHPSRRVAAERLRWHRCRAARRSTPRSTCCTRR